MVTFTEQEIADMIKIIGKLPSEVTGGLYIFLLDRYNKAKQVQVTKDNTKDESK